MQLPECGTRKPECCMYSTQECEDLMSLRMSLVVMFCSFPVETWTPAAGLSSLLPSSLSLPTLISSASPQPFISLIASTRTSAPLSTSLTLSLSAAMPTLFDMISLCVA